MYCNNKENAHNSNIVIITGCSCDHHQYGENKVNRSLNCTGSEWQKHRCHFWKPVGMEASVTFGVLSSILSRSPDILH